MKDVIHDEQFFFLVLNLGVVSNNSTPGNFIYILHLKASWNICDGG